MPAFDINKMRPDPNACVADGAAASAQSPMLEEIRKSPVVSLSLPLGRKKEGPCWRGRPMWPRKEEAPKPAKESPVQRMSMSPVQLTDHQVSIISRLGSAA